jgi:ferritin-like protein
MKFIREAQAREYWANMARLATKGLSEEQVSSIAERCLAYDQQHFPGIWHVIAAELGVTCHCALCTGR